MKIKDLKIGDRLENYRVGLIYVITEITPHSGPGGEIAFDEGPRGATWSMRKRRMTFGQFERLRFLRSAP